MSDEPVTQQKMPTVPDVDVTVYLAGPVSDKSDGGTGWREDIIDDFGDHDQLDFENPVGGYDVPVEELDIIDGFSDDSEPGVVGVPEIVQSDKRQLRRSDALFVAYENLQLVGTPMEVMWAAEHGYPVVLWNRDRTPIHEISPWFRYHSVSISHSRALALRQLCVHAVASKEECAEEDDV
jgi:hypothetical protein